MADVVYHYSSLVCYHVLLCTSCKMCSSWDEFDDSGREATDNAIKVSVVEVGPRLDSKAPT